MSFVQLSVAAFAPVRPSLLRPVPWRALPFFETEASRLPYAPTMSYPNPCDRLRGKNLHLFGHQRRVPSREDRKSTRLNSSHQIISYAVFCLKKKKILQK